MGAAGGAFFAAIGKAIFTKAAFAAVVKTILINVALGAISKALAKKPRVFVPPINVTIRNPIENRRIVFGRARCGGSFVFYDSSGIGPPGKFLWYVIVLAGHQVSAITDVWLDTVRVINADINGGAAGGGAVTVGAFGNRLEVWKFLGTSGQTVDGGLDAAFTAWTSSHRLRGCATIVVRMERDDAKFPQGAPQSVTALVDGALCYDSRLDDTNGGSGAHRRDDPQTWEFTRNPALHCRWYVSGGSVHNDQATRLIKYGLRESDTRILDSFVAAAANICDESLSGANAPPSGAQPRYQCDLEVSTGETRREILESILATFAGTMTTVHGQHRIYAGAYDSPTHTFTQDDLYGQLETEDTVDHKRRYNAVAAVFRDAAKQYIEQTTIFRTDAAYETQDGGKRISIEIDLRGVTNQYQAQRLAEIKLRRSRMMRSLKLVGALNLLKVAQNETLAYSHARYGWSARVFRCHERQLEYNEEAGRVVLTCQREDAGVYTDMLTADYTTGTSATDTFTNNGPDAPTALVATSLPGAVLVTVTLPITLTAGSLVEVWEYTANTPFSSASKVAESLSNAIIVAPRDRTTRFYWATILNAAKVRGAEYPSGNGVAGVASLSAERPIADPEFALATDETHWELEGAGISISATGGVSDGKLICVGDTTTKSAYSRRNPLYPVVTGQQFALYIRWRRTTALTHTNGAVVSLGFNGLTILDGTLPPGGSVGSTGVQVSGNTLDAATINQWQESTATITVVNQPKTGTQWPYITFQLIVTLNLTSGTIEVDSALAVPI